MKEELLNKLDELQKKYPQRKLRALIINDTQLNFAFTFRSHLGVTTIESNDFSGVLYQRITQDRLLEPNDPRTLIIELIVDDEEFKLSSSKSFYLLKRYGI